MDFNSQLSRMKSLMTYGNQVNEDARQISTCSLEHRAVAADGKTYGIIREGHRYYIKSVESGKESLAESYQYLGGFNNKKDYEYDSYAKALKNFELKMASINEACDGKVNIQTLNPFRANEVLIEGTKKMKNEIARQRQIMYNTAMLMNESAGIGKTPFASQPESEHANSEDKDTPFTQDVNADMEFDGQKSNSPKSEGEPYGKDGKTPKGKDVTVKDSVASMHPAGGKVVRVNENVEEGEDKEYMPSDLNNLLKDNAVRFTFIKKDGSIRHAFGTQNVEIAKEVGASIPTGQQPERPGIVPFIDLDMKAEDMSPEDVERGRFWKSCKEENIQSIEDVISAAEFLGGEGTEEQEIEGEESIAGLPGEGNEVDELENDEYIEDGDDDFDDEEGDEESEDENFEDDELEDEGELDDEEFEDDEDGEDLGDKEELGDEAIEDEVDETDPESIRAEIERLQGVLNDLEGDDEETGDIEESVEDEHEFDDENPDEFYYKVGKDADSESDLDDITSRHDDDEEESFEDEDEDSWKEDANKTREELGIPVVTGGDEEEEGALDDFEDVGDAYEDEGAMNAAKDDMRADGIKPLDESKLKVLNEMAKRIAAKILKEEKLNVFGQHPGYRKKPMELPETGEDQNEHGKDWNDESVHSEEPFGQSKGDSKPYKNTIERDELAMKITDNIMASLKAQK